MRRHARVSQNTTRAEGRYGLDNHSESAADEFGEFFHADDEERDLSFDDVDSGAEFIFDDAEANEEAVLTILADMPEWQELYDNGITYIDAAREVFDDMQNMSDDEIRAELFEMTQGLDAESAEGFWGSLGKIAKSVVRVAAPIVQAAAPIVGTAIGGPIGGALGGLLGQAAGAAGGALSRPARRRPATRRRPRRSPRRRARPRGIPALGGGGASAQLLRLIQNPNIQRTLLGLVRGNAGALRAPTGEAMSPEAVLVGLYGGIVESARELQESGGDLDYPAEGYRAADFESAEGAFDTLVSMASEIEG